MNDSVVSVPMAGISSGSAIENSMRALPAPSSLAASKISPEICRKPAV